MIRFGGTISNEEQEELTSGWLLSEVIRNLQNLPENKKNEKLIPVSLST
jgi:hypothetical protein